MPLRPGPRIRGDVLCAVRLARGLPATEVWQRARIHQSTYSQIENSIRAGRPHLRTLAAILDVPADVLSGQHPALRTLREIADLTEVDVAAAAAIDVDQLQRLEAGAELPTAEVADRLAARLGVPLSVVRRPDAGQDAA